MYPVKPELHILRDKTTACATRQGRKGANVASKAPRVTGLTCQEFMVVTGD